MKQLTGSWVGMIMLAFLSLQGISQKTMVWTSKSKAAKELAMSGANHVMNAESEQAYTDLTAAIRLDPNLTPALALLSNLSKGAASKSYAERALTSTTNKTEGEKLFASVVNEKLTPADRREIWFNLHNMFPDDKIIGNFYVQTRATPEERFTAAQEYIAKFPNEPSMYNTIAYYYMQDKKDNAQAKINFEKYINLYPEGANPYDSMGEYYLNTGDMEMSNKYYSMALEKYPYLNSSVNALQKMAESKKAAMSKEK